MTRPHKMLPIENIQVQFYRFIGGKNISILAHCKQTDGLFIKGMSYSFFEIEDEKKSIQIPYSKGLFQQIEIQAEEMIIDKYFAEHFVQ